MESPARSAQPKQDFHRVKTPAQAVRAEGVQLFPGVGERIGQGISVFGRYQTGGLRFLPAGVRTQKDKQCPRFLRIPAEGGIARPVADGGPKGKGCQRFLLSGGQMLPPGPDPRRACGRLFRRRKRRRRSASW